MGDGSIISTQHLPADAEHTTSPAAVAIGGSGSSRYSPDDDNEQQQPRPAPRASVVQSTSSATPSSRRSPPSPYPDVIRRLLAVVVSVLFVATSSNTGAIVHGSEIIDDEQHHQRDWVHAVPYLNILNEDPNGYVLVEDTIDLKSKAEPSPRRGLGALRCALDDTEVVKPYPHTPKLNSIYKALKESGERKFEFVQIEGVSQFLGERQCSSDTDANGLRKFIEDFVQAELDAEYGKG